MLNFPSNLYDDIQLFGQKIILPIFLTEIFQSISFVIRYLEKMALIFKYFFRFMKLLTIFHVVPSRYKFGFQFVNFICSCGLHIHILKKKPSLDCILLQSLIFCTDFKKEKYKNRYINCVILLQLPKGININLNWT